MFKMLFETDNAAFDFGNKETEIARILREAADSIQNGLSFGILHDGNGNIIGNFDTDARLSEVALFELSIVK